MRPTASVRRSKTPCLVLLSGGIDSTSCLAYYAQRKQPVGALFVDYGQPARTMEARAAKVIARRLRVKLSVVRVSPLTIPVGLVNGRNALLLLIALMFSEDRGGLVSIGIHSGTPYADCTAAFIDEMQVVFDRYRGGQLRIDAPFVNWTKRNVYDFAKRRRIPLGLTYSCLRGSETPCGVCESCRDVEALRAS